MNEKETKFTRYDGQIFDVESVKICAKYDTVSIIQDNSFRVRIDIKRITANKADCGNV
jgi:hypothetical protein